MDPTKGEPPRKLHNLINIAAFLAAEWPGENCLSTGIPWSMGKRSQAWRYVPPCRCLGADRFASAAFFLARRTQACADALLSYMASADELIDRNRRLLARAEAARAYKQLVVEEMAENRLRLHVTLLRTVYLHSGRTSHLSELIYLRQLIAEHMITHAPPPDPPIGRTRLPS